MKTEIFPIARQNLKEIRRYTKRTWGIAQADKYLGSIEQAINSLPDQRNRWRLMDDKALQDVFFIRCEHHYIFFRALGNQRLGIISILHESMDIPSRLKL